MANSPSVRFSPKADIGSARGRLPARGAIRTRPALASVRSMGETFDELRSKLISEGYLSVDAHLSGSLGKQLRKLLRRRPGSSMCPPN